jgi:DNA ligase D-like protein (predicted ligase)
MPGWFERKIPPMLASSGQPFDSKDHLFEIKWDGIRTLAFFNQGQVRLQSRRLLDSTIRYPELVQALQKLQGSGVLDGEIVVLEGGKPSFERALVREQARNPETAVFRAQEHPAAYMVFDLLYLNELELLEEPLSRRKERLSLLMATHTSSHLVESAYVLERGLLFFKEAVDQGLEGVVAKKLTSPYISGKRTPYWVKVKPKRKLDCVVLGTVVERGSGRVKSLVLGAYRKGLLVWMGNVGSGLDSKTLEQLESSLGPLKGPPPEGISVSAPGEIRWLRPVLVARVQYMETTRAGRLRAPVFIGFVETCNADNPQE